MANYPPLDAAESVARTSLAQLELADVAGGASAAGVASAAAVTTVGDGAAGAASNAAVLAGVTDVGRNVAGASRRGVFGVGWGVSGRERVGEWVVALEVAAVAPFVLFVRLVFLICRLL